MASEEGGQRVCEDMERVGRGDIWEEVIRVADHEARFVELKLGMEEDLGDLRHAYTESD